MGLPVETRGLKFTRVRLCFWLAGVFSLRRGISVMGCAFIFRNHPVPLLLPIIPALLLLPLLLATLFVWRKQKRQRTGEIPEEEIVMTSWSGPL